MAKEKISPARTISGTVTVPGDKSISHRYALLAALAEGRSEIEHYSAAAPSRYVLQRRDWILGQMQALGGPEMLSDIDAYPDRRH